MCSCLSFALLSCFRNVPASISCVLSTAWLFVRLSFSTGDAMGMNMATIASEAVCRLIESNTGAVMVSV
ncbi:MAG: hypothetical protein IKH16_10045, partial [Selenomonadaceae bacterium]|nr:hypothetical protein [Selenomonadaceae bacterium]